MAIDEGLGKKTREDFVTAVTSRWTAWKQGRQQKEAIWKECRDFFMSQFGEDEEVEEFRSQRFMPVTFEAVMNVNGQMARGLFPSDEFFTAMGDNQQAQHTAKTRTVYMNNRLDASGFIEEYISKHLFQLLVYGNAPYMRGWESRSSRAGSKYEYKADTGEAQTYTSSAHAYDGPFFRSLDLFNFVIDPNGGDREGAIKIYRSLINPTELLALAEKEVDEYSVYDLAAVKRAIKDKEAPPKESSDSQTETSRREFGVTDKTFDEKEDDIELLWAYGDWSIGGKLYTNHVVVLADRMHLIRCEPSPYKFGLSPLSMTSLIPVQGLKDMPYGLGIIESSRALQEIINIRSNQTIDAMALTINPMWEAVEDKIIDPENLVNRPGGIIWVEALKESITALYPPQSAFMGYNELEVHKAEFVDATFSYKSMGAQARQKTATEVATSASLMASVTGRFVQRAENKDIKSTLTFFDECEKQFFDAEGGEVFARYEDRGQMQFVPVTAEIIYQDYTWKAQGSQFTHMKDVRLQQLIQLGIGAAQTPAAVDIDWEEWLRASAIEMGRRDVDKLVPGRQAILQRAIEEGSVPPEVIAQILTLLQQGGAAGGGTMPPGSNTPQGMAPPGRGAMPNAGGSDLRETNLPGLGI